MTTIWERTQAALAPLGLPVAVDRLLPDAGGVLPKEYLVHKMISDPPAQFADDHELARSYRVQVSYFSRAGLVGMPDITGAMRSAGYTHGTDVSIAFNELTRHFGLALDYFYLEELE